PHVSNPTTVTAPAAAAGVGPWGALSLLFGLAGFGLACVPKLGYFGVGLAGLGLLLGLIGLLVVWRRRLSPGWAIAGTAVSVQASLLAAGIVLGFLSPFDSSAQAKEPPKKPTGDGE